MNMKSFLYVDFYGTTGDINEIADVLPLLLNPMLPTSTDLAKANEWQRGGNDC